jgi:hypothetical protein
MVGIPAYTAEYALTGSRERATAYRALSANSRDGEVNPAWFQYPGGCYDSCIRRLGPVIRLPPDTTIEEFCAKRCHISWSMPGPVPAPWW